MSSTNSGPLKCFNGESDIDSAILTLLSLGDATTNVIAQFYLWGATENV
jgi:hypothetical protein